MPITATGFESSRARIQLESELGSNNDSEVGKAYVDLMEV